MRAYGEGRAKALDAELLRRLSRLPEAEGKALAAAGAALGFCLKASRGAEKPARVVVAPDYLNVRHAGGAQELRKLGAALIVLLFRVRVRVKVEEDDAEMRIEAL